MNVFVVLEICDYEYGCRRIRDIFSNADDAQKYIEALGNQEVEFWDGSKENKYIIESYPVHSSKSKTEV